MMAVTQVVLVDTFTPTPLAAGCNNNELLKVAPHCPDTVPALLVSLPDLLGCIACLHLPVQ